MMKTKPFTIPKDLVYQAYLKVKAYPKVKANQGSAGVDQLSLEDFEWDHRKHLYRG